MKSYYGVLIEWLLKLVDVEGDELSHPGWSPCMKYLGMTTCVTRCAWQLRANLTRTNTNESDGYSEND